MTMSYSQETKCKHLNWNIYLLPVGIKNKIKKIGSRPGKRDGGGGTHRKPILVAAIIYSPAHFQRVCAESLYCQTNHWKRACKTKSSNPSVGPFTNHQIHQSIRQSAHSSTTKSTSPEVSQPIHQPSNQPVHRSVSPFINPPTNCQSTHQPTN